MALPPRLLPTLEREAQDVATFEQYVSPRDVAGAMREVRQDFSDPLVRKQEIERLRRVLDASRQARRSRRKIQAAARQTKDPDVIEGVGEALKAGAKAAWSGAGTVLGSTLKALDAPAAVVRKAVTGEEDYTKAMEKVMKVPVLGTGLRAGGRALDIPVAALTAGVGTVGAFLGPQSAGEALETGKKLFVQEALRGDAGGRFIAGMALDPLTYLTFGAGGAAKAVSGQVGRALAAQGIKNPALQSSIAQGMEKALQKFANTPKLPRAMDKVLWQHGVNPAEFKAVMGGDYWHAGKAGLEVGIPFGPKKELVGRATLAKPFETGAQLGPVAVPSVREAVRAGQRAVGQIAPTIPLSEGGRHAEAAVKRQVQMARGTALKQAKDELEIFDAEIRKLGTNIKPARQQQIVQDLIDPSYDVLELLPNQPAPPTGTVRYFNSKGFEVDVTTPGAKPFAIVPKQKPGALTMQDLSPAEAQWMQLVEEHYERQYGRLKEAGLLGDNAFGENLLTGKYIPRIYKSASNKDIFEQEIANGFRQVAGGYSPVRQRKGFGGMPLGSDREVNIFRYDKQGQLVRTQQATERVPTLNPEEIVSRYQPAVEKKLASAYFDQWIGENFRVAVPKGTKPADMKQIFIPAVHPKTGLPVRKAVYVPIEVYDGMRRSWDTGWKAQTQTFFDKVMNHMKGLTLFSVPRTFLVNVFGDSAMMVANGFRNPKLFVKSSDAVWKGNPTDVLLRANGKTYTVGEIREFLRNNGVGTQRGMSDMDAALTARAPARRQAMLAGAMKADIAAKNLPAAAERAAGGVAEMLAVGRADPMRGALEAHKDFASLGVRRPLEALAEWWDAKAKTAFFVDRLAKGESMNQALESTFKVLFDYSDQDAILRQLRKVMPFASYTYKSATAIPRTIIRNPKAVTAPSHFTAAYGAQPGDKDFEAPTFASELSRTMPLNQAQREAARLMNEGLQNLRNAALNALPSDFGVIKQPIQRVDPGYGMALRIREPIGEGLAPLLELANGNPDPFVQSFSPLVRFLAEYVAEKDLFSKRPLARPQRERLFNYGDPLAVELENLFGLPRGQLQADEGQSAWLSRYFPSYFAGPLANWVYNEVARASGALGPVVGVSRPYSENAAIQAGFQALNLMTGMPVALTTAGTALINKAQTPLAKGVGRFPTQLSRARKQARIERLRMMQAVRRGEVPQGGED